LRLDSPATSRKRRRRVTRIDLVGDGGLAARPLVFPVEVRLVSSDGACWAAAFSAARKNDARATSARVR
jgi:hypothetical protein